MSTHIMNDIETFGTGNRAVILSLGSVKFDPEKQEIIDSFYVSIDPASCVRHGMQLDVSTIMWWMSDERAEARSKMMAETRIDVVSALDGFAEWFGEKSLPTWGNGATFDNVILRNAFELTGLECPWKFWDDRCYRTFKNQHPEIKMNRKGTYHNALDDAISQVDHAFKIIREKEVIML